MVTSRGKLSVSRWPTSTIDYDRSATTSSTSTDAVLHVVPLEGQRRGLLSERELSLLLLLLMLWQEGVFIDERPTVGVKVLHRLTVVGRLVGGKRYLPGDVPLGDRITGNVRSGGGRVGRLQGETSCWGRGGLTITFTTSSSSLSRDLPLRAAALQFSHLCPHIAEDLLLVGNLLTDLLNALPLFEAHMRLFILLLQRVLVLCGQLLPVEAVFVGYFILRSVVLFRLFLRKKKDLFRAFPFAHIKQYAPFSDWHCCH